jgi:REP element-mobilizing transposase RayT
MDIPFPMRRYKNTYRIDSTRWTGYDYTSAGWYHVVICTQNRACVLGRIRDGVMGLSRAGCVASTAWPETVSRYDRAITDVYIVMPNHVHLIVGILPSDPSVETRRGASLPQDDAAPRQFGPLRKHSLSSIINHYKGRVTKRIRRSGIVPDFAWQRRFYDRVIRNERERRALRQYVLDNPLKWHLDRLHPDRPHHPK